MVQQISSWVPVSKEQLEDAPHVQWTFEASLQSREPQTDMEHASGWRLFTSSNGLEGQVAVGWRYEQMEREAEEARQKAMAECSYVACTCGWHEDD